MGILHIVLGIFHLLSALLRLAFPEEKEKTETGEPAPVEPKKRHVPEDFYTLAMEARERESIKAVEERMKGYEADMEVNAGKAAKKEEAPIPQIVKERDGITYEPGEYDISCLATPYFCVEGLTPDEVANLLVLKWRKIVSLPHAKEILNHKEDGNARGIDKNAIPVMISYELNGWVYIKWGLEWYEECNKLAKLFMNYTDRRVNYFHVDPWTGDYAWTLCKGGKVVRQFYYDGGEVVVNEGTPIEAEEQFLQQREVNKKLAIDEWAKNRQPFIEMEEVFGAVLQQSGQHIEELNKHTNETKKFLVGHMSLILFAGS